MLCILLQVTSLSSATENSTTPMLAYRVSKKLNDGAGIDATLNIRFLEGFLENEREIAEIRYSKLINGNEYMGAYNLQFDRRGQSGSEHRLWQQVRHQFVLPNSAFETQPALKSVILVIAPNLAPGCGYLIAGSKTCLCKINCELGMNWYTT